MMHTRFWLIRHAIVAKNELERIYGNKDVPICPDHLAAQGDVYRALAARLPKPATWYATPLSRTQKTAEAIFAAGYPAQALAIEPGMVEQNLGALQGVLRSEAAAMLRVQAHPFWPISASETPDGGESMDDLLVRVGATLERLVRTHAGGDVVIVSHGGPIRAAAGHAMGVGALPVLHLAISNLSLTRLDRFEEGWRVDCVNALSTT